MGVVGHRLARMVGIGQQNVMALGCAILKDWYESLKGRDGHQNPGRGGCALWDLTMLRSRSPTITGARYRSTILEMEDHSDKGQDDVYGHTGCCMWSHRSSKSPRKQLTKRK